ncbi:factor-independent urate hydroxylase [Pseudorhodoplanes sinuspersici]|uniref:Uricase n=1 Tax=Pseudorhodoplanes sinuspersici TaxID=1235591 RepID=A0A1W6ZRN3_9HYPH|nr:urate oxidase [Pseudorhodoplanes sinuspersici]ARP99935.1 urate oxidase [Pseudorhodoplanes sinuspersici]RKE70958.1 urate oxidase [Pseudorhodoplanes sinuspersici]
MALISNTYGKGRVRVMRIKKDGPVQEVRELNVKAMLTGGFAAAFTDHDNSAVISTDTVKNVVNIVARENLGLDTEAFGKVLAARFLDRYPQVESVRIELHEVKWVRMSIGGKPHPHSFVLDNNGQPFVIITASRAAMEVVSGITGFTFMKSTESGWDQYYKDEYTTIAETRDRMCATAMDARWRWSREPEDFATANAKILSTMLEVFATTYSESVQDSLYRMGTAALAAVPEIEDISLACPNKHYLLINLQPFGLTNENAVFLPTDEPHGQIECTIGRW